MIGDSERLARSLWRAGESSPPPERAVHRGTRSVRRTRRRRGLGTIGWLAVVGGCILAAGVGAMVFSPLAGKGGGRDSASLADMVMAAAATDVDRHHPSGWRVRSSSGVVVAEGIPPDLCASAGWVLAKRGLLSVNGVTPGRLSATAIVQLCHSSDPAELRWVKK